jgi:hypothetical protein
MQTDANLTVVLFLERGVPIHKIELINSLRQRYPDGCRKALAIEDDRDASIYLTVFVAGYRVTFHMVDAPLSVAWEQIAVGTGHWPDAISACSKHRAHLTVTMTESPTNLGDLKIRLTAVRMTTAIAGAFLASHPDTALAGLWGATALNTAEVWENLSRSAFAPASDLPVALWVNLCPFQDGEGNVLGVLTTGLDAFVGRELELVAATTDMPSLLERARALVAYFLWHGPLLKDGKTFAFSDAVSATCDLRMSERFAGIPVIAAVPLNQGAITNERRDSGGSRVTDSASALTPDRLFQAVVGLGDASRVIKIALECQLRTALNPVRDTLPSTLADPSPRIVAVGRPIKSARRKFYVLSYRVKTRAVQRSLLQPGKVSLFGNTWPNSTDPGERRIPARQDP